MVREDWVRLGRARASEGGGRTEITPVIIYSVSSPNKTFLFISLQPLPRQACDLRTPSMRQGFSHFLAPNLIEMSKLVGWLCQREGEKILGSITHLITHLEKRCGRPGQEGGGKALPWASPSECQPVSWALVP